MEEKLNNYLEKNKIKYIFHEHPAVFTVEESKKIKANPSGMHTKSLFLKDERGLFYLVCMDANKRLNTKLLREKLSVKKLNFASPQELKRELNLTPGSVSIFGLIYSNSVHLILDRSIWEAKSVGFHPNINTATLEIKHEDLEKFYNSLNLNKEIIKLE